MGSQIPLAVIFGCAGSQLTLKEQELFKKTNPFGLILFERNCFEPDQVKNLTGHFRDLVGRSNAPVFIDQEGGRVTRLKPPSWRFPPPAKRFADLALAKNEEVARQAIHLNSCLIAEELKAIGINVNCAPVLDILTDDADPIIGDRALGNSAELIEKLGFPLCYGLLSRGVFPVIKHIPGHGRAPTDSHTSLPIVNTRIDELMSKDFEAFRRFNKFPLAMTAHVIYSEIDKKNPATVSHKVIEEVVRNHIGFDGVLISDDLSMKALKGDIKNRTKLALDAGCDLVLHCNGKIDEMFLVVTGAKQMTQIAWQRWLVAEESLPKLKAFDKKKALSLFHKLMEC